MADWPQTVESTDCGMIFHPDYAGRISRFQRRNPLPVGSGLLTGANWEI